jgi:RNA polymerase sigma factor (sigma-70 family)
MTGITADPGRPAPIARETQGGLDLLHRAPPSRHPLRPFARLPARGPRRRSAVSFPPGGPEPPADPVDDEIAKCVERIQAGVDVDENFEWLYARFYPRLFAYFRRQPLAPERCEELAQDALFNAFHGIASFEHRSSFTTWLWGIVHHVLINEGRRQGTAKRKGIEVPLEESLPPDREDGGRGGVVLKAEGPSPYEELEKKEQLATLHEALASLSPKMRRCAALRYVHGLKYREIAVVMRLKLDTVKAHLGHTKRVLKERLGPRADAFIRHGSDLESREEEP